MDIAEVANMFHVIGLSDELYKALTNDDLSELPMTFLKVTDTIPIGKFVKQEKSKVNSKSARLQGNQAYKDNNYVAALLYYNKSLLYAPDQTEAMALAYSNRSFILFKVKAYKACLKDIQACLDIGYDKLSEDVRKKLMKRKEDCEMLLVEEEKPLAFAQEYFNIDGKRHPQIPCASTDVDVVIEADLPKVIAGKAIKIGTVVAVETPYVSLLTDVQQLFSCHYCHRVSFNLIPCPNCCFSLFCNKECLELSMKELHSLECHIMELLTDILLIKDPMCILALKAALKIKLNCSWKEFITASHNIGCGRMKSSSVSDIYDAKHRFSLLNFVDSTEIQYGKMYNFGYVCGFFLNFLSDIPTFMPICPNERNEAKRAVARLTMKLYLQFCNRVGIQNVAKNILDSQVQPLMPNYALLSFTSKLSHECDANLLCVGLNNKVALVAVKPIEKGTELTISYVHIMASASTSKRAIQLYKLGKFCRCPVCTNTWHSKRQATNKQKEFCMRLTYEARMHGIKEVLAAIFRIMNVLKGLPHTNEFQDTYRRFENHLAYLQFHATQNYGISF